MCEVAVPPTHPAPTEPRNAPLCLPNTATGEPRAGSGWGNNCHWGHAQKARKKSPPRKQTATEHQGEGYNHWCCRQAVRSLVLCTAEACDTLAQAGTWSVGAGAAPWTQPALPVPQVDPGPVPIPQALTTPFSTQKPSWYLESGRRMTAVVTGGQCTMFSVTSVWCFSSWKVGWGLVRFWRAIQTG